MNPLDKSMLFVLHPRDISIEISDVAPHAVTEAVYTSSEGTNYLATILLKRWRDRLFFRTRYDFNMIFAITEPCLYSESDLVSFFHKHYSAGRYGRYFAQSQHSCFLISPTEGVWTHDWICGPWFQMDYSAQEYRPDIRGLLWDSEWEGGNQMARHSSELSTEEWINASTRGQELYWRMQDTVFKRKFDPAELSDFPETWIHGSIDEARQLVQACVTVQPYTHKYVRKTGRKKNGIFNFLSEGAFKPQWHNLNIGLYFWGRLISAHNYFVGWKWFNTEPQTPYLRSSWQCRPTEVALRVDRTNKTNTEVAAAFEFLSYWVEDKVEPSWKGITLRELTQPVG